jgi:two-component system, sensor histidine kinase
MNKYLSKAAPADDIEGLLLALFGHRSHFAHRARRASTLPRQPPACEATTATMPNRSTPPPAPPPAPAPPAAGAARRRHFRASDVAIHLDMAVIGDVCVGVGLAGYRSVLVSFLDDESGSQAALLAALARADTGALRERAHALKGAAASMGLRAVQAAASRLETEAHHLNDADRAAAAANLRQLLQTARALLQRMGFA